MTLETYRHPANCREVWLRLANRFPAAYNTPPAKLCGSARDALVALELAHGNSTQKTALAFREWLADEDDIKTKDFETAIREFWRIVEWKEKRDAD